MTLWKVVRRLFDLAHRRLHGKSAYLYGRSCLIFQVSRQRGLRLVHLFALESLGVTLRERSERSKKETPAHATL